MPTMLSDSRALLVDIVVAGACGEQGSGSQGETGPVFNGLVAAWVVVMWQAHNLPKGS